MAITKKELAIKYCPFITPRAAENQLMRWINNIPELTEALARCGYRKNQKMLTTKQYQLIVEFLGEP